MCCVFFVQKKAPTGFEPVVKELQSSALPLGYGALVLLCALPQKATVLFYTHLFVLSRGGCVFFMLCSSYIPLAISSDEVLSNKSSRSSV